jgi:hypothetical protein
VAVVDLIFLVVFQIAWPALLLLLDFAIPHGLDREFGLAVETLLGLHHGHGEQRPPPSVGIRSVRVVDHKQQRLLLPRGQLLLLGNMIKNVLSVFCSSHTCSKLRKKRKDKSARALTAALVAGLLLDEPLDEDPPLSLCDKPYVTHSV